jgi:hypothetical protein
MSDAPTSGGDRPEAALPDAEALARAGWSEEELTLTNKAVALRHDGKAAAAEKLFDEALAVWACSGPWVLGLGPERRARSSTFHLRLERRHSRAYEQHARARLTALAEQGQSDTKALKEGGQWQKERPANYVDARKLLAAVLLLADPPK